MKVIRRTLLLALLALAFAPMMAHAQDDDHPTAPTIEQCRLDFASWKGVLPEESNGDIRVYDAKLNLLSDMEMIRRVLELSDCVIVVPDNDFPTKLKYHNLSIVYQYGHDKRMWSFLKRKGLWERFLAEEDGKKTEDKWNFLKRIGELDRFIEEDRRGVR